MVKDSRSSSYNKNSQWLGWKLWKMKNFSQFGDIRASETLKKSQLSSSHFPFPKNSVDHPSPSSVLWKDEVQRRDFSHSPRWLKAKWGVDTWIFFIDSSLVLQGTLYLANLGRISNLEIPICIRIRNKTLKKQGAVALKVTYDLLQS